MILDSPRPGSRGSVWQEMMNLRDEMSRLLPRVVEPWAAAFPAVNLWSSEESAVVTTELPGVLMDDLDISVVGDTLTIRGTRSPVQLKEGENYHRRERGHGKFTRSVDVSLEKNVLTIYGRVEPHIPAGHNLIYSEYALGDYHRSFSISNEIDWERIEGTVKNGVLTLTLPKAGPAQTRKISVKPA